MRKNSNTELEALGKKKRCMKIQMPTKPVCILKFMEHLSNWTVSPVSAMLEKPSASHHSAPV